VDDNRFREMSRQRDSKLWDESRFEDPNFGDDLPKVKAVVNLMTSDKRKLTGQKLAIVKALRIGPRPNYYFPVTLGIMKYTNRTSELNKMGYINEARRVDNTGVWIYHLIEDPDCSCMCDGPLFCEVHREEGINEQAMMVDDMIDEVKHHGPRRM
jgi:hypothetical protein